MIKVLSIAALIAFAFVSMNKLEISKDSTSPTFSTKLSMNAASHTQLAELERQGY